jgi:hypothetical protein
MQCYYGNPSYLGEMNLIEMEDANLILLLSIVVVTKWNRL